MASDLRDHDLPVSIRGPARAVFQRLAEVLPTARIAHLATQVQDYVRFVEQAPDRNPQLSLDLVRRLAAACQALLADYPAYSREHRALVVGAARYFVESTDANNDWQDLFGFDDDLAVINAVAHEVGRDDLVVTRN